MLNNDDPKSKTEEQPPEPSEKDAEIVKLGLDLWMLHRIHSTMQLKHIVQEHPQVVELLKANRELMITLMKIHRHAFVHGAIAALQAVDNMLIVEAEKEAEETGDPKDPKVN